MWKIILCSFFFATISPGILSMEIYPELVNILVGFQEENDFLKTLKISNTQIDNIEHSENGDENRIIRLLENIPDEIMISHLRQKLKNDIDFIDSNYHLMKMYLQRIADYENHTLLDFADNMVGHSDNSVYSKVYNMYRVVKSTNSIKTMIINLQSLKNTCRLTESVHLIIKNIYDNIMLSMVKSHSMIQFSYDIYRSKKPGNFTVESQRMSRDFDRKIKVVLDNKKLNLKIAPTDFWRCDPREHILGETYDQITRFMQGYVVNEIHLNKDGNCFSGCSSYSDTRFYKSDSDNFWKIDGFCSGNIYDCKYLDKSADVCLDKLTSSKKYKYIKSSSGNQYGTDLQSLNCPRGLRHIKGWWTPLMFHCSLCMCTCDATGTNSERYFSLNPAESDVFNNKVVTGVRFTKKQKVIHLQIQQSNLLPYGEVNQATTKWKPVRQFEIFGAGVYEGRTYQTLSKFNRSITLGEWIGNSSEIVTGIRFSYDIDQLRLQIRVHRFNYQTGKLLDGFDWIPIPYGIEKIDLSNKEVGTEECMSRSLPISRSGQYLDFSPSSLKKDFAQTTVPLIDTQLVNFKHASPLSGLGIHYKRVSEKCAGFIAPKIIGYNYGNRH